jgi:hypothetical protein
MAGSDTTDLPEIVGDRTADGRLVVDIATAGRMLGISRSSAFKAADSGDLPSFRVGGRRLVPVKALRQLLDVALVDN